MTTEREQLELAAKACGEDFNSYLSVGWNPLTDDGDCARMEARLGICVDWQPAYVSAMTWNKSGKVVFFKDYNGDKNAARRAASVAVAAEIGRMK